MAVNKKIRELQEKREKIFLGGGEEAIEKQKAMGKRTARERIMALLDNDSFMEYDMFVEHDARDFDMDKKSLPSDGVIIGSGTIYGAPGGNFRPGFYGCRGLTWTNAFQEDNEDNGPCPQNENAAYRDK